MKRYFTAIVLFIAITARAQDKNQYLDVSIGGGLHNLKYNIKQGNVNSGFGGAINLGYSYFLNTNWGLGTGISLQSATAKGKLSLMNSTAATDQDGDNYELRTYFNDWKEKQKALFLNIPIGMHYQNWFSGRNGLLAFAGLKFSIPLSPSYKVTSGSIVTTGYYEQWNVELMDLPQHGFSRITERPSGSITLKPSYSLFAELGWLREVSDKFDLYVGGYINYGLNNIVSGGSNVSYTESQSYKSMINTSDKVRLMTFGAKIGLRLHVKRTKKVSENIVEEAIPVIKEEPTVSQTPQIAEEPAPKTIIEIKPEPTPEPVVSMKDTIAKSQVIANQIDLKFPLNSEIPLNDEFDSKYKELALLLKANPNMKVRIQGHTCDIASREYNLQVGKKRAEVVKNKLTELGVPESQIITESKAFDEPLVPNTNENNRSQNRRVKIIIE